MKSSINLYWLKSAFFAFSERISVVLFGFGTFFILIRSLTITEFGIWSLFLSVTTVLELIKNGFIRTPLIKFLSSADEKDYSAILTASLVINLLSTFILGFGLVLLGPVLSKLWGTPELSELFFIYFLSMLGFVPFYHFEFIQHANLKFKGAFFSYVVHKGLFFIYILLSYLFIYQTKLSDLVWAYGISVFAGAIVSFFFARPFLRIDNKLDKVWINKLFHYGKYSFGTNLSSMLFKNIDSWMLGWLISPSAVALYNPTIRISNLVEVPTVSLASIVFPQISKRIETEGISVAKYLYEKSVGVIMAIMLPILICFIVFADKIIIFVAGTEYLQSIPILQITMLYGLFLPFHRQFGITLDAIGKPHHNFYFVAINALLNGIFNYVFISEFGVIGAAYGTLTTFAVSFIYVQVYLNNALNIKWYNTFKYMLKFYAESRYIGRKIISPSK